MGRDLATTPRSQEHDLFGVAVLIYQLLFAGWHPFAKACDLRSLEARILAGDCPQIVGGADVPPDAPPFGGSPEMDVGDDLRSLFIRAFVAGHTKPRLRPTAEEWVRPLARYERLLAQQPRSRCKARHRRWRQRRRHRGQGGGGVPLWRLASQPLPPRSAFSVCGGRFATRTVRAK